MSRSFKLEIITPTREFLEITAEAVSATTLDGEITVLAGHAPMVAALGIGELKCKEIGGAWRKAFHSEGFLRGPPGRGSDLCAGLRVAGGNRCQTRGERTGACA